MTLKEKIENAGVDNCLFIVKMRPMHTLLGLKFKRGDDEPVPVPAIIDEKRYKIKDNYKITLVAAYEIFGSESYYISDLENMIKMKQATFFIKG